MIEPLKFAWNLRIKSSTTKFILVAMADIANEHWECYPSVKYLECRTSLNRKTILSAIESLRHQGILEDTGRRTGATNQIPVYRIVEKPNSPKNGTVPFLRETVPILPPNSPNFTTKQSQKRDTDPQEDPQEDPIKIQERSPERLFSDLWCEQYPTKHSGNKYVFEGAKDAKAIKRLLNTTNLSPHDLFSFAVLAWENKAEWNCKQAATISGFACRFNQIRDALSESTPNPSNYSFDRDTNL